MIKQRRLELIQLPCNNAWEITSSESKFEAAYVDNLEFCGLLHQYLLKFFKYVMKMKQ